VDDFHPPIEELAELIVGFAANVQPDQMVSVLSEPGKEEITRAVADAAYRRGARFVDVWSFDPIVKRSRIRHAPEDTLDYVPPWWGERALALGEMGAARIALEGPAAPGALDDVDPRRAGRDRMPRLREIGRLVNDRSTNWTGVPAPTPPWAALVYPELDPEAAYR
jgi:aminopeptidase